MVKGRKNMTRVDIIDALRAEVGVVTKVEASEIVDTIFETIKEALVHAEVVKLDGLGNFSVRNKRARRGRNPQTGDPITITARRTVTFRVAASLKQSMNQTSTGGEE